MEQKCFFISYGGAVAFFVFTAVCVAGSSPPTQPLSAANEKTTSNRNISRTSLDKKTQSQANATANLNSTTEESLIDYSGLIVRLRRSSKTSGRAIEEPLSDQSEIRSRRESSSNTRFRRNPAEEDDKSRPLNSGLFYDSEKPGRDSIQFPPSTRGGASSFVPDHNLFKECAGGGSFCEHFDNYPKDKVEDLIKNDIEKYKLFFENDKPNYLIPVSNKHGFPGEEKMVSLCSADLQVVYPRVGITENNTVKYIVNVDLFRQPVVIETCREAKKECNSSFMKNLPMGYSSTCEQKNVYRRLVALEGEAKGKAAPDEFLFPACCKCSIINDYGTMNRLGSSTKPNTSPAEGIKTQPESLVFVRGKFNPSSEEVTSAKSISDESVRQRSSTTETIPVKGNTKQFDALNEKQKEVE